MNDETRATFFRQGGWVSFATFTGGFACYLVHLFAQKAGAAEYGNFTTAIRLLEMAALPAVGLQTVIAHQAASARTPDDEARLTATVGALAKSIVAVWLVLALALFVARQPLGQALQISHPATLAMAFATALCALLLPLAAGTLQGRQQFAPFGGVVLSNGLTRLLVVAVLFEWLRWRTAPAGMSAVLLGYAAAVAIAWWTARFTFTTSNQTRTDWKPWLRRFVPLSLGAGAGIFLMSVDMIFVKRHFGEIQAGLYGAASTFGRVVPMLLGPIIAVMFPKIVRAAATGTRTRALEWTLAVTAIGGALIAGGLTLWPELPLRLARFKPEYMEIAPLIPQLAWAMVPLVLGGVLVNYLLARDDHRVVPWLLVLCVGYAFALEYFCTHWAATPSPLASRFTPLAWTLGAFNCAYLAVTLGFALRRRAVDAAAARAV